MGWSYLRLQQYPDALAAAQKAIAINPNDPRVVQIIGEADVFLGKIDDALKNLEEYVVLRPGRGPHRRACTGSWASATSA